MKVPELLKLLKNSLIFGFLDDDSIEALGEKFILQFFSHGECIVESNSVDNDFFIIFSGTAKVIVQENAKMKNIATLKRGDFFGEHSILNTESLTDHPSVFAIGDLVVAKLKRDDFLDLMNDRKEFANFVETFSANQALQSFLKNFGSFGALSSKESAKWLSELKYENIKNDGDIVFYEGDIGDKFYIVASGGIEIIKNINGNDVHLVTLGEGKFFGEMALMSDEPRAATAKCVNKTQLISIDKDKFTNLVNSNPAIANKIKNIIDMYRASGVPKDAFLQSKVVINNKLTGDFYQDDQLGSKFTLEKAATFLESMKSCTSFLSDLLNIKIDKIKLSENISKYTFDTLEDLFVDLSSAKAISKKLKYKDLKKLKTPYITKLKNSIVVVYSKDKKSFKIADPLNGFITLNEKEFKNAYDGDVIFVNGTSKEADGIQKITLHSFLKILRPYKKILLEIFGTSIFISLLALLPPIFISILIDDVLVQRNENMLIVLIVALIVVAVFTGVLNALRSYLQFFISGKLQVELLGKFFSHLVTLPVSFFMKKPVSDIIGEFESGSAVEKHMSKIISTILIDGSTAMAFLIALFLSNSKLFLVFIGFVSIIGGAIFAFTYYVRQYLPKTLSEDSDTDRHTTESINNIATIKVFCAENLTKKRWETMFINNLQNVNKYIILGSISNSAVIAMRTLTTAVILAYASILALSNEISIGQALAFNMISMLALVPLGNIVQIYHDISSADYYASGLNKIYGVESEGGTDDKNKPDLNLTRTDVEFRNITFAYENSKTPILNNFSLNVNHGEYVAIIGKIGSGKSTVINMLTRVANPNSGHILLGGTDISQVNLTSLRSNVGVIFQELNLFAGTVKNNISFGMPNASIAEIVEAATLAGAHDFIINLPGGYDTVIGEKGMGLSGGQKRLIAISRALVSNPPLIIMDEPTNDLDIETEQIFKDNLKTIGFGRTMFIITHRASLIRDADKIVVLDNGEVVEVGTHSKLIADKGYYFYLCAKQIALS